MNSAEPIAHSYETDLFESNKSQEVSFNNFDSPGSRKQTSKTYFLGDVFWSSE